MKKIYFTLLLLSICFNNHAQWVKDNYYRKGNFSIYWGWNRSAYSTSNIHFKGGDYDFKLMNVIAKDRQSKFDAKIYLNPARMTIPQYNFRIGYFFHDHYQISLGADHMKYVMQNDQFVKINGEIDNGYISPSGTDYNGVYTDEDIQLKKDFLLFKHTDGLNYENIEVRRFDVIFGRKNFAIAVNEGLGIGLLIPRTNTTLMNNARYDEFHLAGYGFSAVASVNLTFFKYFFIQTEWKGGFIHMPDIRTTMNKIDKASQYFWFSQYNAVFGANFRFKSKEERLTKKEGK